MDQLNFGKINKKIRKLAVLCIFILFFIKQSNIIHPPAHNKSRLNSHATDLKSLVKHSSSIISKLSS
jgi:hypothetical protein